MRKLKRGRKLSRKKAQRVALLRSLAEALIWHEKIRTTEAKAKELRRVVEKMVTRAKKGDLSSRRRLARLLTASRVQKLVNEIAPRFRDRKGGYTRIIKLGRRSSDGAPIVIIEFLK